MNLRKKLFLADGHGLAYRAFFAMINRPLRTSKGENTSVPWGVTRLILKLLAEYKPDYLGFIFDSGHETFRHEIFESYKATRQKLDETNSQEFGTAMGRVMQILEALHIPTFSVRGFEADDVIGSLARQSVERGVEAVIVSGDMDFYQLIGPRISVLEPGRGGRTVIEPRLLDAGAAAERMGVLPEKVIDYLALVGDPSDNIPGVRGIGPKSAEALLGRFGTLEEILAHVDEIESKRMREALKNHQADALLSKTLVTIRTDVPITLDLEAFQVQEPDRKALRDLFLELEFNTLLHEIAPGASDKISHEMIDRTEALPRILQELKERGKAAIEVIQDREGPRSGPPAGLALATAPGTTYYLPLNHRGGPNLPPLESLEMRGFMEALASPAVVKIGHNLKRVLLALRHSGKSLPGPIMDTMLAAYCLDSTRRQYDLEIQVVERFGHRLQNAADICQGSEPFSHVHPARVTPYAAERADLVLRLADRLLPELDDFDQRKILEKIELPLLPVLVDMEWTGIAIDRKILDSMSEDLEKNLDLLRDRIYRHAGGEFNIDSVVQLREILFERLKLPIKRRTKTGPSTDADVLAELASEGHELPERLVEYREMAKLKSTYVDALRALISPETGRLHTSFNQAVAATGRLSSSEPNLQNIPIRTPLGASIRKAFVPAEGYRMLVADYSQIELRILAHMSRDPVFLDAFRGGRDIHRETAAILFRVELPEVTSSMRDMAKTVNYATLYGQGAFSLSRMLGIGGKEAQKFIEGYFERFPAIRSYLDSQTAHAEKEGYVETLFGRRRYVPELRSKNPAIRGFGRRVAWNSPLQGSAADLIKLAMIRIHGRLSREGLRSRMLLQIHDELLFEAFEEEVETMKQLVRKEMEGAGAIEVPLVADIGVGGSWYDAKRGG
jgi:DNA polymerase I